MTESKPSKVGLKRQALTEPGSDECELRVKKSMMDSLEDSLTESFEAIAVQPGPSTSRQIMTNAERWSKFKANLSEEKKAELREKDRLRKARKNARRSDDQRKVLNQANNLAKQKLPKRVIASASVHEKSLPDLMFGESDMPTRTLFMGTVGLKGRGSGVILVQKTYSLVSSPKRIIHQLQTMLTRKKKVWCLLFHQVNHKRPMI